MSEKLLVRKAVSGTSVRVEESLKTLVLETLTTNRKVVQNRVLAAFEALILHSVQRVMSSPEYLSEYLCWSLDVVIDIPRLNTLLAAVIKSAQLKLLTDQAKKEEIIPLFVDAWIMMDLLPV